MSNIFANVVMAAMLMGYFLSCNTNNQKKASVNAAQPEREIPYSKASGLDNDHPEIFLQNLGKLMGLPVLNNGQNLSIVRIWIWANEIKYVIDVSGSTSDPTCSILEFNAKGPPDSGNITMHKELKDLIPKSGWDNFFSTLDKYQITNLKGGKPYEDQKERLTEMTYVQFEVAKPYEYRFYQYLEPSFYRYVDTASSNIVKFLEFFSSEMDIPVYHHSDKLFVKP